MKSGFFRTDKFVENLVQQKVIAVPSFAKIKTIFWPKRLAD